MNDRQTVRPNVVWITLDSVRHDRTTVGGHGRPTTPNLQAIADRDAGRAFAHCIAAGNWSLPSTASIHTGTYPEHHRAGFQTEQLPDHVRTIPELLGDVGYRTVGVSANHYFSEATGLDRGFDVFKQIQPGAFVAEVGVLPTARFLLGLRSHSGGFTATKNKHRPDYLVNRAVESQLVSLADGDEPFFLSAHYHGAHVPYYPPPAVRDRFEDDIDGGAKRAAETAYRLTDDVHESIARADQFDAADWDAIRVMYDTIVAYCDRLVGDLFDRFESLGLENTVVVVTADHGDLLGEYDLLSHKFVLHDGLVRVPLVVHDPTGLFDAAGDLVQHVDLVTTLVGAAGGETDSLQGYDLREGTRDYAFSQRGPVEEGLSRVEDHDPAFDDSVVHRGTVTAVRTESFKYRRSDGRAELFELPDESTDVSDRHPDRVTELDDVLTRWHDRIEGPEIREEAAEFSEDAKERLTELGYLVE